MAFTPYALDRLADEADYAVIGPHDGRTRVADTRAFPYSAVCFVEREFGDGRFTTCTAFLIGPTTLLTAGHCVASPLRLRLGIPGVASRVKVWPGRDGKASPYGFQWARRWRTHPAYLKHPRPANDIAVIELDRPFEGAPGYFATACPSDAELKRLRESRLVHVAGYPADKPAGTQWEHAERLDRIDAARIRYSVDTCPGHSGSPVWILPGPGKRPVVIGVHTAGPKPHAEGAWGCKPGAPLAPAGLFNSGRRLTPELRHALRLPAVLAGAGVHQNV